MIVTEKPCPSYPAVCTLPLHVHSMSNLDVFKVREGRRIVADGIGDLQMDRLGWCILRDLRISPYADQCTIPVIVTRVAWSCFTSRVRG